MAYRDAPIVLPKPPPNLALPSRMVGIAMLGFVLVHLVNNFGIPDELRYEWYRSGSRIPIIIFWIGFLFRGAVVPGAIVYGLRARADDDRPRARLLAFAGAALIAFGLLANVWNALHPAIAQAITTRPYWAPAKYVPPLVEQAAVVAFSGGLTALAWALAPRGARSLATVVTVFAFGNVFYQVIYALEIPWIQLMSADRKASVVAGRVSSLAFQICAVAFVGVALGHPRAGAPRPLGDSPRADRAPEHAAAYDGVAPLVAGVLAATIPLALVCGANAVMTLVRTERDFDNWMSAAGIVRLQYFETMTYVPYGALACAAGFCVYASWRARESATTSFIGIGALALAITTVTIYMRGRWKVPIDTLYDFTHFQVLMAACAAAVFLGTTQLARTLRAKARVLATEEENDIHTPLFRVVDTAPRSALVAALLAGLGFLVTAFGDLTTSTSTHSTLAVLGGLSSVAGALFAIAAAVSHHRGRPYLAEVITRRAREHEGEDSDPASLM